MNTVDWSTPHPLVTAEYRAGIEAHKATQNALDDKEELDAIVQRFFDGEASFVDTLRSVSDWEARAWEREMASLPDDGVTYVVEGESRV